MPVRLTPEDFQRPECREVYRAIERDAQQPPLAVSLREYLDSLLAQARRWPRQTESQLAADLAGVVRRIRERTLRRQLREAQYLLAEADGQEERQALSRQVGRLATQLGRVQLEQSRSALYTTPLA
jgi:replicative DNA helicase